MLARLRPGDHFGELALLADTPRTATVRATTRTVCWSVTSATFERIVRARMSPSSDRLERDVASGRGPGGAWGSPLAARLRATR